MRRREHLCSTVPESANLTILGSWPGVFLEEKPGETRLPLPFPAEAQKGGGETQKAKRKKRNARLPNDAIVFVRSVLRNQAPLPRRPSYEAFPSETDGQRQAQAFFPFRWSEVSPAAVGGEPSVSPHLWTPKSSAPSLPSHFPCGCRRCADVNSPESFIMAAPTVAGGFDFSLVSVKQHRHVKPNLEMRIVSPTTTSQQSKTTIGHHHHLPSPRPWVNVLGLSVPLVLAGGLLTLPACFFPHKP